MFIKFLSLGKLFLGSEAIFKLFKVWFLGGIKSAEKYTEYDLLASRRLIHVIMSTLQRQTFTVDDSRLLQMTLM